MFKPFEPKCQPLEIVLFQLGHQQLPAFSILKPNQMLLLLKQEQQVEELKRLIKSV